MKIKNPFSPNGVGSLQIIYNQAKTEFGFDIKEPNSYSMIKKDIIRALKKMKVSDLEENYLNTVIGIEHLQQNDFGSFISVRLVYWGLMITIAVIVAGEIPIYQYFNISKKIFGTICILGLFIMLMTMSRTIHTQHDQLEYLKFKLICFDEIRNK